MVREAEPGRDTDLDGAIVLLMDSEGRVLLQQRDDDVPPAGYGRWQTVGGRREAGESIRETAVREFEEETGVTLRGLRFMRTAQPPDFPRKRQKDALFFSDEHVDPATIEVREGLAFSFWSPAEVAGLSMNPGARSVVDWFFASDFYLGSLEIRRPHKVGVCLIQLDRWGRVLLQLRDPDLPPERAPNMWALPGGHAQPGEAPDAAVFREFEEETGQLLDTVKLYQVFRRPVPEHSAQVNVLHVYYVDGDVDEDLISVNEGQAFRYYAPDQLSELAIPPWTRGLLEEFFDSTHYRGMFH